MKLFCISCVSIIITLYSFACPAQKIERFEHLTTVDGLSQNSVTSIFCDSKGYMWFGTMNGLNRYNGYNFQTYIVEEGKKNVLSHNRINKIWEDERNNVWLKTYDEYVHYFIPETEEFISFPDYLNSLQEKNSTISHFEQSNENEIWLGSTHSGAYHLKYNPETKRYETKQYSSELSHEKVHFILADARQGIWIGTKKGLNHLKHEDLRQEQALFTKYDLGSSFTCGVVMEDDIYFGTKKEGLKKYNTASKTYEETPESLAFLKNTSISLLHKTSDNQLIIGTNSAGLFLFDPAGKQLEHLLAGNEIQKVYEDHYGKLWINTAEFGIYQFDPQERRLKKYTLTSPGSAILTDDERQFIYEDSNHNFWIGFHGSLALYKRAQDTFEFYKNDPKDPSSISSNIVYCIAEDKSGLLWLGTGKPKGGVDKIIMENPSMRQLTPASELQDFTENVVRGLYRDSNDYLWTATKSGQVYILSPDDSAFNHFSNPAKTRSFNIEHNVYTIIEDRDGYIWMGSKGGGIWVSREPVGNNKGFYDNIQFNHYTHQPADSTSLSSDNVYSIHQDHQGRVWIGTYGGGLNLVKQRTNQELQCIRLNTANSGLSSNDLRYVYEDSQQRLWVATTFGLNLLNYESADHFKFRNFFYKPDDPGSLSYNDVIHIYEDSHKRLWFTTFGGGINRLSFLDQDKATFERLTQKDGLLNDAVVSVLEDQQGFLWFGTEKGISRLNYKDRSFENFDKNCGLAFDSFSESTGCISPNNYLLFGNTGGILLIAPDRLTKSSFEANVVLTNFQVFNKDVDYHQPESPIQQHIESLDEIELEHSQSSFSIEYAALSYFASSRNRYAFKLENFDQSWNEVGNQRKATYTNLLPGRYIFKVKAASWDGTWSQEPRTLAITISAPWWKTKAAYLIYAVLSLVILEIIRRSYTRYQRLQNDLQVEKRVSEIKLNFFTNISHEIRTPLTLILGPLDDIKATNAIPAQVASKLHIMERNGKRMLQLVNQLLDFRKIQKQKMKLKIRKLELNEFLQDILLNFKQLAEQKKINLHFDTSQAQIPVWIDNKKFDSVIFNILSNAYKFTGEGKKILVKVDTSAEKHIDICIQDEGPGIPKDKRDLLFQRFTPLSAHEEMNSSGIGLSLAYEIVKLHGGEIMVDSEEGKGSSFIVRILKGKEHLPGTHVDFLDDAEIEFQREEALLWDHHLPVEEEKPLAPAGNQEYSILIVEDNPEIVNYLKNCLCPYYKLKAAKNGSEALRLLSSYHPDLIITDIMMPVMDGIEMTKKIKESLDTSHIPVIMLTAKSTIEDQIIGVESGAEAYLLKPFNSRYLKTIINNLLKQRKTIFEKYLSGGKDHASSEANKITVGEIAITSKDEQFLLDIRQYIEENYSDPDFNVERLVENTAMSRTVLYNKIKGLTGFSPIEFLRQIRLKIAEKLLLESDHNVSEVAYMTGFNNVKYFRQHFKKLYGMTPSEFKTQNASPSKEDMHLKASRL